MRFPRCALVLTVFVLLATPELAKPQRAWWVDFERLPTEIELFGLRVSDLDPSFTKASLLSNEDMPSNAWTNPDFSFAYKADIDGDGKEEIAQVGTYEARDGTLGRWLVIRDVVTRQIEFLQKFPGAPGFSALGSPKGKLMVAFCLYCGDLVFIQSAGSDSYRIIEPDYAE